MDERMTSLIARLRERFPSGAAPHEVEAYLSSQGFDRRQIGEILSLLFPDTSESAADRADGLGSIRVLAPHEQSRFSTDAWGHLVALRGGGVLNAAELEYVIERALMHIDGRIALDDLRALMEGVGLDEGSSGGGGGGGGGAAGDQTTVH